MTENKNCLIKFEKSMRRAIKLTNNNKVTSESMKNILVIWGDGQEAIINDELYVLLMESINIERDCKKMIMTCIGKLQTHL